MEVAGGGGEVLPGRVGGSQIARRTPFGWDDTGDGAA